MSLLDTKPLVSILDTLPPETPTEKKPWSLIEDSAMLRTALQTFSCSSTSEDTTMISGEAAILLFSQYSSLRTQAINKLRRTGGRRIHTSRVQFPILLQFSCSVAGHLNLTDNQQARNNPLSLSVYFKVPAHSPAETSQLLYPEN